MPFQHEKFVVYQKSLDFVARADVVVTGLRKGRAHLANQLGRASTSIVLNIAEGAGKFHPKDKRRYYLSALGSATECAGVLDICARIGVITTDQQSAGKSDLDEIVRMLTALAKSLERRGSLEGEGEGGGEGEGTPLPGAAPRRK
jgi:four helix bundle protein